MSNKHDEPPAYSNPAYPQPSYQHNQPPAGMSNAAASYYQVQPPMGYGQSPPPGGQGGYYYPQQQGGPYPPAGYYQPGYGPPQQREKRGPVSLVFPRLLAETENRY